MGCKFVVDAAEIEIGERPRTIRFAEESGEEEVPEMAAQDNVDVPEPREAERVVEEEGPSKPQPTALQQKMLQMAGQDIDEFMREVSYCHKRHNLHS